MTSRSEVQRGTFTEAERVAIREQVERMLANPLFKHSRRYPKLLRYVVERTLDGGVLELKERTIGVEVFGRNPNYDTNADPIVRASAGEVRKRIAQYYHEHGHEAEIRIDLTPGSYVPEFVFLASASQPILAEPAVPPREASLPEPPPPVRPPAARSAATSWPRGLAWAAVWFAVTATLVALAWFKPWTPCTALDAFWGPVVDAPGQVRICIGQRRFAAFQDSSDAETAASPRIPDEQDHATPVTLFKLYYMGSQNVAFPDVMTVGRITGLLQTRSKTYRIRGEASTTFADLRDGPVVLVGAFNNDWTMRLTGPMRFSFARDNDTFFMRDRQHPERRNRSISYATPYTNVTEDYALISRVLDPTTERMVVIAGGLTGYGTIAAGEFLTNSCYMHEVSRKAPKDWARKNMQLVIATRVINGNSGRPRVVDQSFW